MKGPLLRTFFVVACVAAALVPVASGAPDRPRVLAIEFENDVNPVTADYVTGEIDRANDEGYDAVAIVLDTPGGLSEAMRDIYKKELASRIPVIVYVGGIDEFHDLEPLIDALGRVKSAELHVVGNGEYRARAEARAASHGIKNRFYGHVPHPSVPHYIAAADLCIAPYRTSAFHDGLVTFATLKIPEYMACARPVVSVPSPAIQRLIEDGVNGFLLPNDTSSWTSFLAALPPRERLASMGRDAAESVRSIAWDRTARRSFEICEELTSGASPLGS